jgi:hypothetical protein
LCSDLNQLQCTLLGCDHMSIDVVNDGLLGL